MTDKTGLDMRLYYADAVVTGSDTSDYAGANWTELGLVGDVTPNDAATEIDMTARANRGMKAYKPGHIDLSYSFDIKFNPSDAGYAKLATAYRTRAEVCMAFLDGVSSGSGNQGWAGNFVVTNFARNEPLDDKVTVSVTVRPSTYVAWWTVAGS